MEDKKLNKQKTQKQNVKKLIKINCIHVRLRDGIFIQKFEK
jgi:hypothetical protein